jgi:hypothetical protein
MRLPRRLPPLAGSRCTNHVSMWLHVFIKDHEQLYRQAATSERSTRDRRYTVNSRCSSSRLCGSLRKPPPLAVRGGRVPNIRAGLRRGPTPALRPPRRVFLREQRRYARLPPFCTVGYPFDPIDGVSGSQQSSQTRAASSSLLNQSARIVPALVPHGRGGFVWGPGFRP